MTKISKLYDEDILDLNYNNIIKSKNEYSNRNNQEIVKDSTQRKVLKKPDNPDNSFDSGCISGGKSLVDESGLRADKSPNKYKCLDDKVFEDMQRQMHITDHLKGKSMEEITDEDLDNIITPEHKESIKKIQELLDD